MTIARTLWITVFQSFVQ